MPEEQNIQNVTLGILSETPQGKRIIFTNENPNSQGSIVRNSTIDFSRYKINPVLLADHNWKSLPIGRLEDIRLENGNYTALPVFHEITEQSREYKKLYEGGWLRTASIGGMMVFRKDLGTGQFVKDEKGNKIGELNKEGYMETEYVDMYEVSLPTLPANPTAVTEETFSQLCSSFSVAQYDKEEINNITGKLVTLSSELQTLNLATMATKKANDEAVVEEAAMQTEKSEEVKETTTEDSNRIRHIKLEAEPSLLEGIRDYVKSLVKSAFAHPEGEYGDMPIEKAPEKEIEKELTPKALETEEEVKAEAATEPEETKETEACTKMEETMSAPVEVTNSVKQVETKLEMNTIPEKKTAEEMAGVNLAAAPATAQVHVKQGATFTKLSQDKGEGQNMVSRILNPEATKSINDYNVVLGAIMDDPKLRPFVENTRFHLSVNEQEMNSTREVLGQTERKNNKVGITFSEIAARLNGGYVNGIDWKLGAKDSRRTTLSTDSSFSSLDLNAVEWLPTVLYALFPQQSWKSDIPVFSVADTGRNLGVIWTNIAANAAVYRGTNPSPAAHYTYSDTAVGLKLTPYWLQPTRWTPMDMHTKRYDMYSTGMAQNLKKMDALIDDDLLYTLGAGALANSRILYTGGPIDSTQDKNFTVGTGGNGVDAFYFNSAFAGSLLKPGFNDIMKIEQLFKYLNFDLASESAVMIGDSIVDSYIKQDKATQSYLTRWIQDNGADVLKISRTKMYERSRVLAYDPSGGTVIDTNASGAVIPSTTQSANLAIVPSQVGIGLGIIDVFFVQDPANYGFVHSMDMRTGIRALRSDYKGVTIYAYGAQIVP